MSLRWPGALIVVIMSSFALAQTPTETPAQVALRVRRADAENRALFQSSDPLPLTLEANFGVLNREREAEDTKVYPGLIKIADAGRTVEIPVQLSARGHLRRKTCDFVPLSVGFPKKETKGTVFEMRAAGLKLVTQCSGGNEYEQYILKEYLAYRLLNLITPRSYRARLARVSYVDSTKGKTLYTRYAFFLEDDDDIARRLEGKVYNHANIPFIQLHPVALIQMMLFEFMIGNTDYSIMAQHNVRIVETQEGLIYPIPHDFDVSGLVHVPYGAPDPRLKIDDLSQRLYRGPCRTPEQLAPFLNIFRSKKDDMLAAIDSQADLNKFVKTGMKTYLTGFFTLIDKPSAVNSRIVKPCIKSGI